MKDSFVPSEVEGRPPTAMQYWVYILRCADGSFYTGHTDNLDTRIAQHQAGEGSDWTRRRRPVELAWCEAMASRLEALEAEHRIKPWSRAKKEALVGRDWQKLSHFSRPPHERPSTSSTSSGQASLGTNDGGSTSKSAVRTERSAKRVVEVRCAKSQHFRPSTSLGTNGEGSTR